MNEAVIREKLLELSETITRLPKCHRADQPDDGIYISHSDRDKNSVEASLQALGLQVSYLLFDLEATRRENRYLRQMLESRPKPGSSEEKSEGGPAGQ